MKSTQVVGMQLRQAQRGNRPKMTAYVEIVSLLAEVAKS